MNSQPIEIKTPYITLQQLLKPAGAASSGGAAKELIAGGGVMVNGQGCAQRGRKLYPGDSVALPDGARLTVTAGGAHEDS